MENRIYKRTIDGIKSNTDYVINDLENLDLDNPDFVDSLYGAVMNLSCLLNDLQSDLHTMIEQDKKDSQNKS